MVIYGIDYGDTYYKQQCSCVNEIVSSAYCFKVIHITSYHTYIYIVEYIAAYVSLYLSIHILNVHKS